MVSIVRLIIITAIFCITSDQLVAQHKNFISGMEITSPLVDKGKRDRLRQIYNRFWKDRKVPIKCSYLVLNNLSRAGNSLESAEAFDCVNTFLAIVEENRRLELRYADAIEKELGESFRQEFLQRNISHNYWRISRDMCPVALMTTKGNESNFDL